MSSFRLALLGRLCGDYARSLKAEVPSQLAPLNVPTSGRHVEEEEESGFEPDVTSDEVRRDRSSFLMGNREMWTVPRHDGELSSLKWGNVVRSMI